MKYNQYDREIKNAFNAYRPDLDNDEIWDNIEPHLDKKKKRRFIFFWFLLGGLGLLFYVLPVINGSENESIVAITEEAILQQQTKQTLEIDRENELVKSQTLDVAASEIENVKQIINSNQTKSETQIFDRVGERKIAARTIPSDRISRSSKSIGTNRRINGMSTSDVQSNATSLKVLEEQVDQISESSKIILNKEDERVENTVLDKKEASTNDKLEKDLEILESTRKDASERNTGKENENKKTLKKSKKKKKWIKPRRKSKWRFYWQSTASYVLPIRVLKPNFDLDVTALSKARNESEKILEGYGLTNSFQMVHKDGLVLLAGLEMQRQTERFDKTETEIRNSIEQGAIAVVENAAGEITRTISGDKEVTTTLINRNRHYNHHFTINLPIGIGKVWKRKKFNTKLLAGLDFNLAYRFSGVLLNDNLQPVSVEYKNPYYNRVFKKSTGVGLWIGGEYNMDLNRQVELAIAPKFQLPLSNVSASDYSLVQKYYKFSLQVGINYLLNPKKSKKKKSNKR